MFYRYILFILLLTFGSLLFSEPVFTVKDKDWDEGKSLVLNWDLHRQDGVISIFRTQNNSEEELILESTSLSGVHIDGDLSPNLEYKYRLHFVNHNDIDNITLFAVGVPTEQWFYMDKLPLLLLLITIASAILYYIYSARNGREYFIRRINGLDSMEEAIGRATEKGKPILFVPGIGDLEDIQTIASLTILSHLSFRAAEYNTEVIVPCRFSMVLSAAREVVKEAYLKAGKPDAYRDDRIFYLTEDQFGFVAGIDGIMVREQPAANFFLGTFYAESLILAETGFSTGAIQTSGTANAHQLPFFIVSCDYTLIGEELFAASAYLSKDPQQLGSLKGHDFGKILIISLIAIGVLLEILSISFLRNFLTIG